MIQREYPEACALHSWLEARGVKHFHSPNETGGNRARGAMNKRAGVSKGVPDFLIFISKKQSTTGEPINIAIELKEPSGKSKATPEQRAWLEVLAAQGFESAVCHGFIEAAQFVRECGLKNPDNDQLF